jgi:hypothetical protein
MRACKKNQTDYFHAYSREDESDPYAPRDKQQYCAGGNQPSGEQQQTA